MNNAIIRQYFFTIIACGITALAITWNNNRINKKIAVVDAIQLVNSYKMKLELEAESGELLTFLGRKADSLKQDLTGKSKVKDFPKPELDRILSAYRNAQGLLEQQYQQSNQSINEQVWKRLNPLIDEYGKGHGFRLIIGANGMGSVLYNDAYYERTKELIDFVNKKYEEGN